MNPVYVIPFLLISYLTFTCLLTLGTSALFINTTFRNLFLEHSVRLTDISRFEIINQYLNLVVNLYIFTVLFATPLYLLYTSSIGLYIVFRTLILYFILIAILLSVVYIVFVFVFVSTELLTPYLPEKIQPYSNTVDLSRKEIALLTILSGLYMGIIAYVYISTSIIVVIPLIA